MTYDIDICGMKRALPVCPLSDTLAIGAFVMFGDVELTVHSAAELLKRLPPCDYLIAPEAKAIPLIHEMARQSGRNDYFLVRKKAKVYMGDVFEVDDVSITTEGAQKLYMAEADAEKMRGKRVLIIDDVTSTGGSFKAVEHLVNMAGGIVAGKLAILAEGDAAERNDIRYLQPLPLFDREGNPVK